MHRSHFRSDLVTAADEPELSDGLHFCCTGNFPSSELSGVCTKCQHFVSYRCRTRNDMLMQVRFGNTGDVVAQPMPSPAE